MVRLNPLGISSRPATASGAVEPAAPHATPASRNAPATEAFQRSLHQDVFEAAPSQPPVQLASFFEGPPGQRARALEVVRQAPPGSVGAAIEPLLAGAMGAMWGSGVGSEFAAGNVGDFYEQQRALLNSPATDANIAEFSRRETHFFQTQSWLPRQVGGLLSAEARADLIRTSRDGGWGRH